MFESKWQLRAEISRLENELDRRISENESQSETLAELTGKLSQLTKQVSKLNDLNQKLASERDQVKKIAREQTEADILLNALKAVGVIKKSENYNAFIEQDRLIQQRSRLMEVNTSPYQSSLAGSLGLGGLIG